MACIINADNGVISGSAGVKTTADTTGVLNIQTNGVTAISISSSQVVTFPSTTSVGTVNFGDGTATFPSIAHAGDTNTGIYFPGTDQVAITTAGTQRVLVDASGNVGIGTSSPAGVLEVATNASGDALVTSYNSVSAGTTAAFTVRRARGTAGSPSAVLLSDALGGLYARGYKATAFSGNVGVIRFEAAENWTDTANGTYITFAATPIGSTSRTEYMRIDPSGNLGLGVTPSAWGGTIAQVLQLKNGAHFAGAANSFAQVGANSYFDGTNYKYVGSSFASRYLQNDGTHAWFTAPSGTAGNTISFTQAMTLDTSGNLSTTGNISVGFTGGVTRLGVRGPMYVPAAGFKELGSFFGTDSQATGNGAGITLGGVYSGTNVTAFAQVAGLKENSTDNNYAGYLAFYSRPNGDTLIERARITSGGNLLVGTTNRVNSALLTVNNMGLSSYNGSGNSTINTIAVNAGAGGGMCVIAGVDFQSGASFSRLYLVAVRVGGGTASQTALIGSAGTGSASFSFAESGGFLTVTGSGFSGFGASWTAMFINT